jgi:protein tyrosine phosphatase (PTP) superfamily phosphohydrolase (DUF442 family)
MNFSKITDQLYVGTAPKADDYGTLHSLGVSLVINMVILSPPKRDPHTPPMKTLWLPTIDSPIFPLPIPALRKGVVEALKVIKAGGIVYTHCAKGRHRGPAMGACILIAQGISAEQSMELIKQQRPVSDLHIWYIKSRINRFAQDWEARK